MYEYKCKVLRIVDGDTVDIDIDLGNVKKLDDFNSFDEVEPLPNFKLGMYLISNIH